MCADHAIAAPPTAVPTTEALLHPDIAPAAFQYFRRLHRVRAYVERNLSTTVTVRRAAEVAGLNQKYFSTYFHQKTGVRFRDWVTASRVAEAARLLRSHNEEIGAVALRVGFRELRTFERAFRRLTGTTPRRFKALATPKPVAA